MDDLELFERLFKKAVAEVEAEERERARPSADAAAIVPTTNDRYRGSVRALVNGGERAVASKTDPPPVRADPNLARELRASVVDRGSLAMERRRARTR